MMTPAVRRARPHPVVPLLAAVLSWPAAAQTLPAADETAPRGEALPKWEAGVLFAALTLPDYPASDDYRRIALPLPYFIYRGRVLRTEQEGSRLRQRLAPHVELDISGGGALASDAGSDARRGMPDLDYLVELGPTLRLSYDGPRPHSQFIVNLPVRGVASVGSGIGWQGVLFAPELAYVSGRFAGDRLTLRASLGSEISSTQLQRYYYEVQPQYATATRPAYAASAGYLGSSIGVRATYTLTERVSSFVGLRYYNHAGAANDDSPLFRSRDGYSAAVGLSWSFLQSAQRAEAE